jgi:hypothetical protein
VEQVRRSNEEQQASEKKELILLAKDERNKITLLLSMACAKKSKGEHKRTTNVELFLRTQS